MRAKFTHEEIAEALAACDGVFAAAARRLGCRPETVSRRVKQSSKLRTLCLELEEARLDRAEGKLMEAVDKGTLGAITFYLRAKGKTRGYGSGAPDEGKGPAPSGSVDLPEPAKDAADWERRFKPKR